MKNSNIAIFFFILLPITSCNQISLEPTDTRNPSVTIPHVNNPTVTLAPLLTHTPAITPTPTPMIITDKLITMCGHYGWEKLVEYDPTNNEYSILAESKERRYLYTNGEGRYEWAKIFLNAKGIQPKFFDNLPSINGTWGDPYKSAVSNDGEKVYLHTYYDKGFWASSQNPQYEKIFDLDNNYGAPQKPTKIDSTDELYYLTFNNNIQN